MVEVMWIQGKFGTGIQQHLSLHRYRAGHPRVKCVWLLFATISTMLWSRSACALPVSFFAHQLGKAEEA